MSDTSSVEEAITHEENKFSFNDPESSRNPAFLEYSIADNVLDMLHTFVPPALRGRGVAGALVKVGLKHAASRNLKVRTTCWYTADFVKKYGTYGTKIAK